MKYGIKFAALAVAGCTLAGVAQAAIIYEQDFTVNPGVGNNANWDLLDANSLTPPTFDYATDGEGVGTEAYNAGGGDPIASGEARVTYSSGIGLDVDRLAGVEAGFLGDYTTTHPSGKSQYFSFDFYWEDTSATPSYSGLQVYFVGNGITWYYAIDTSTQAQGTWRGYEVEFGSANGWTDTGAGGTFTGDAASVTEIGFRFNYITSTDNTFAFDNFRRGYNVPEPETYAAIAAALIGLCLTQRKRLSEIMGSAARVPWAV